MANPLGWFEASGLSPAFADAVASLARIWKGQRDELHAGVILPVGTRPSGASTCGFVSLGVSAVHLLIFREPLAVAGSSTIVLPGAAASAPWQLIAGKGTLERDADDVRVTGLGSPDWAWWRAEV